MCFHHVYEKPVAPLERIKDLNISEAFNALIMKCLEKDPKDRFQSMNEAIEALENLEDKRPVSRETIERMTLKEESGVLATKSDIGQSDEKHVPQNEEFFDAETMAHAAGPDAFPAVPVDSMAPTARRTVDFFPATESGCPMDTKAFDPPSPLKDAVSWTENGTHQTAVTQENVAMSLAPPHKSSREPGCCPCWSSSSLVA